MPSGDIISGILEQIDTYVCGSKANLYIYLKFLDIALTGMYFRAISIEKL